MNDKSKRPFLGGLSPFSAAAIAMIVVSFVVAGVLMALAELLGSRPLLYASLVIGAIGMIIVIGLTPVLIVQKVRKPPA